MAGLGTIFVELDLDKTRWERSQRQLYNDATSTALSIEKNFKNLGIKSSAEFDLMRQRAQNAFDMIKASAKATANDIIRAEKAYSDQIKKIHEEQYGHQKSLFEKIIGDQEMSIAGMTRAMLRLYAAFYVVAQAAQAIVIPFEKGFNAVEDYKKSVASLAAMVVTFSKPEEGQSLAGQWQKALEYSSAMVPVLENIAAKTLLSGQETTALANAFARTGVFLDASNKSQIEAFTRISNALPLMTQGQEIMRQINTEIRAVMTGSNEASSMMLQTLKAIDPEIESHLKVWREEGTVLEHIGELLVGFGPATKLLENTWEAVKSTLDTTVTQVLRGGMAPIYEQIIESTKSIGEYLEGHKETIQAGIIVAWNIVSGLVGSVWGALKGFGPLLSNLGQLTGIIAYGWGGVMAAMKPIGEILGNTIALAYELVKMLGQAGAAMSALIMLSPGAAKTAWDEAKKSYSAVGSLIRQNYDLTVNGIADAVVAYDNQVQAALAGENKKNAAAAAGTKFRARLAQSEGEDAAKKNAKKAADEYARLVERANEWKRTASLNQETSDMGTFRAELEKNAAEAEKLKAQFAGLRGEEKASVYALIEKEELRKNEIARLKEEAAQRANAVESAKKQAKAEQESAEIRDAATEKSFLLQERTINNRIFELDLAKQAGASYREQLNERIALEQQLLDIALKRIANTSEVTDYASYAALEKDIQRFRTNIIDFQNANTEFIGTFLDGWERAYAAWNDQTITWATAGKKIFNDLSMNLTSSMGDMFFSTIKGQFDDLGDAFKSFCDNMLRAFTDMLAQMAVKGMMETISSGVSGVMGLIGLGGGAATGLSAFGGSAPSISGPVFSSGLYFHRGGIVGETAVPSKMLNASLFANAPRFHNGLAYDEFPAILQKGEAVIPKDKVGKDGQQSEQGKIPDFNLTIVAADAKSFSDMVKRNPGAIIKPITDALKSNAVNKEWRALLA